MFIIDFLLTANVYNGILLLITAIVSYYIYNERKEYDKLQKNYIKMFYKVRELEARLDGYRHIAYTISLSDSNKILRQLYFSKIDGKKDMFNKILKDFGVKDIKNTP